MTVAIAQYDCGNKFEILFQLNFFSINLAFKDLLEKLFLIIILPNNIYVKKEMETYKCETILNFPNNSDHQLEVRLA